ncbi:asparagine synthase-related protein [Streptomyces sp. NPDC054796]
MHRFIVGRLAAHPAPSHAVPREGTPLVSEAGCRAWSVGHDAAETSVTPAGGPGPRLVTAGHCLATDAERHSALAAGCRGDLRPALLLSGCHLTVVIAEGEVRVAGDGAGVIPLYWLEDERGLWWATAATPLAALADAAPDLSWLLGGLALDGVDFRMRGAPFTKLRRVPPGSALVWRGRAAPAVVSVLNESPALSRRAGAAQFREVFSTAVARRTRGAQRVTTDLSGGVDSSSVTSLAAREQRVLAVTYTDARTADDDDVLYARRLAREVEGITHRVIKGGQVAAGHFAGLEDPAAVPATDLPSLSIGVLPVLAARLAPVAEYGSTAHLTGRGGDNVLLSASSHRVDQLLAGQRLQAVARAADFARTVRIAPWRAWRQLAGAAFTSYPRALGRLADQLGSALPAAWRPGPETDLGWCGTTAAARWLTPAGRRAVAELVGSGAAHAAGWARPAELHDRLALEWMAAEHATFDALARQRWGVPIHAPFLDTAVVETCFAIPPYERVQPGVYKPLARAALSGLVPDWLLSRQTKTLFTTSVFDGLAANAPALRRILAGSRLAQAGLLDAARAARDLEAAVAGAPAPLGALHALLVSELWLARLPATTDPATWWTSWTSAPEGGTPCR